MNVVQIGMHASDQVCSPRVSPLYISAELRADGGGAEDGERERASSEGSWW